MCSLITMLNFDNMEAGFTNIELPFKNEYEALEFSLLMQYKIYKLIILERFKNILLNRTVFRKHSSLLITIGKAFASSIYTSFASG